MDSCSGDSLTLGLLPTVPAGRILYCYFTGLLQQQLLCKPLLQPGLVLVRVLLLLLLQLLLPLLRLLLLLAPLLPLPLPLLLLLFPLLRLL